MSYGYVYVAQVAMGADIERRRSRPSPRQRLIHGPSLIIGYAPCEMHGIKGGMQNCQTEMKNAPSTAGYWQHVPLQPGSQG